jgi:hypothetical protein
MKKNVQNRMCFQEFVVAPLRAKVAPKIEGRWGDDLSVVKEKSSGARLRAEISSAAI